MINVLEMIMAMPVIYFANYSFSKICAYLFVHVSDPYTYSYFMCNLNAQISGMICVELTQEDPGWSLRLCLNFCDSYFQHWKVKKYKSLKK